MAGVSTLGQSIRLLDNIKSQQGQFQTLSQQLTSGKKTQSYAGLKTDALTSMRSRTEVSSIDIYISNITRAETTIGLGLNAIEEFQAQTQQFSKNLLTFKQEGHHQIGENIYFDDPATTDVEEEILVGNTSAEFDADMQSVINHAGNLFDFFDQLLNAQEGDKYLLAGADSSERPFSDTGTLGAAVSTLLAEWKDGNISTEDLIADLMDGEATAANPNALTDATIGYSSSLSNDSAGRVFIRTDEQSEVEYTTLANEKSFRNVMVAMAVFSSENFPPIVDVYEDGVYPATPDAQGAPGATAEEKTDNFYQLFNALSKKVLDSIDGIDKVRFGMETVRVQINRTHESHVLQKNLLLSTVSDVEDVDTTEVAVKLTTLQTQLEASYRVTALSRDLSLVNFL